MPTTALHACIGTRQTCSCGSVNINFQTISSGTQKKTCGCSHTQRSKTHPHKAHMPTRTQVHPRSQPDTCSHTHSHAHIQSCAHPRKHAHTPKEYEAAYMHESPPPFLQVDVHALHRCTNVAPQSNKWCRETQRTWGWPAFLV